jgi:hypothetical protein
VTLLTFLPTYQLYSSVLGAGLEPARLSTTALEAAAPTISPGERCPLIDHGCGAYCRYNIAVTPDAGHYIERKLPDGRTVKRVIETAKGNIDGRCWTKRVALEKVQAAGLEPARR